MSATLGFLLKRLPGTAKQPQQQALLLGLMDWTAAHPKSPLAVAVMERGLRVTMGRARKTAAELALVLGHRDVLETLAERDPDQGVRKLAKKLLAANDSAPDLAPSH